MSGFTETFYTHSSRRYQDIMISFISLYIILITGCVNLLSAVPEISVSGPVGSTAVLPCNLTSVDTDTLYIKWKIKFKTQYKTVFEREGEESDHGEGYEGRVDVPVEQLRKGNCSLVLHNLTFTDTEDYSSYQTVTRTKRGLAVTKEISRVHLTVSARTEERPDKNLDSPDKAEERTDENSDSSGDTEKDSRYWWWILIVPGLVIPAGFVWWFLKRKKERISEYSY